MREGWSPDTFIERTAELSESSKFLWEGLFGDRLADYEQDDSYGYFQGVFEVFLTSHYSDGAVGIKAAMDELQKGIMIPLVLSDEWLVGNEVLDFSYLKGIYKSFLTYLESQGRDIFFGQMISGSFPSGPRLFDVSDRRLDHDFTNLKPEQREDLVIFRCEIHHRDKYECDENHFRAIVAHLRHRVSEHKKAKFSTDDFDWWGSVPTVLVGFTPKDFRNIFRAGLTDYKDQFKSLIPNLETRLAILRSLEATVQEEQDEERLDTRITDQLVQVKWYLDQLGLEGQQQEMIFNLILAMEPKYRDKERKVEVDQNSPDQRAPSFSHLLRVLRIGLGLLDAACKRIYRLDDEAMSFPKYFFKSKNGTELDQNRILEYCFSLLTHDLPEDAKITHIESASEVRAFLRGVVDKRYSRREHLLGTTTRRSQSLNKNNYSDGLSEYVIKTLLSPDVLVPWTKMSDFLQNSSSPYSRDLTKLGGYSMLLNHFWEKGLKYLVPDRLPLSALVHNPALLEAHGVWSEIEKVLGSAYGENDMTKLASAKGLHV